MKFALRFVFAKITSLAIILKREVYTHEKTAWLFYLLITKIVSKLWCTKILWSKPGFDMDASSAKIVIIVAASTYNVRNCIESAWCSPSTFRPQILGSTVVAEIFQKIWTKISQNHAINYENSEKNSYLRKMSLKICEKLHRVSLMFAFNF